MRPWKESMKRSFVPELASLGFLRTSPRPGRRGDGGRALERPSGQDAVAQWSAGQPPRNGDVQGQDRRRADENGGRESALLPSQEKAGGVVDARLSSAEEALVRLQAASAECLESLRRLEAVVKRQQTQLEQAQAAALRGRDASAEAAHEQRAEASARWKTEAEARLAELEGARASEDLKAWAESWFFATFLPEARHCAKAAAEGVEAAAAKALEESRAQTCAFLLAQLEARFAELDDRVLLSSQGVKATLLRPDTANGGELGAVVELHHPMQRSGDTVYMRRARPGPAGALRVELFPVEDADGPVVCFT